MLFRKTPNPTIRYRSSQEVSKCQRSHIFMIKNIAGAVPLLYLAGAPIGAPGAPLLILYNKGAPLWGTLHWPMRTQLQGHMILTHPITGKYYLRFSWEILPYIILKPYPLKWNNNILHKTFIYQFALYMLVCIFFSTSIPIHSPQFPFWS